MELQWMEYYDEYNNTYWESKVSDKSYTYFFRIKQRLQNDKRVFYEDSSPELWLDWKSHKREYWITIEDAKYEMHRHYLQILKDDTARSL